MRLVCFLFLQLYSAHALTVAPGHEAIRETLTKP